jgi:hypothetical protein
MKLWAAAAVHQILREDPEDGRVWWENEPGEPPYIYAGRYRTPREAMDRLHRLLGEGCVGFDLPRRRGAILRSSTGPKIARDDAGKRIGYATMGSSSSGVPDYRLLMSVVEVEGRAPYDVKGIYVTCSYCNGTGKRVHWPAVEEATCRYCEGTRQMLTSMRTVREFQAHERLIAYRAERGYPPHTPINEGAPVRSPL